VFNKKEARSRRLDIIDNQGGAAVDRLVPLPVPGDYPAQEDYKYSVEGLFDDAENPAVKDGPEQGEVNELSKISDEIAVAFQGLISDELYNIRTTKDWIEVDIQSSVLFPSGRATLSGEARELMQKIAGVLESYENPVQVEGFTDNQPIETLQFPSNWELSAARAAAVVRLFEEQQIDPKRLSAVGYGEHHPVAENDTEAGRAENRRVALIISRKPPDKDTNGAARPDYKLGVGTADDDQPIGSDPQSRIQATQGTSTRVPQKILSLENSGVLFGDDTEPEEAPAAESEPAGEDTP
ncbi:MAG: OmpA family protein, partial [Ketobacteraceae bacterium]|nr:OmpA family protein [Ketobacteraceae bacterium]